MIHPSTISISRRRLIALAQSIVSLALIFWILHVVTWRDLLHALHAKSPGYIVGACLIFYVGTVIACIKWQLLLRIDELHAPLRRLVGWNLIGAFTGNVLPSDIGGDVFRGYYAARHLGHSLAIARSIILDRLGGLLVMLLLAWVGLIIVLHQNTLAILIGMVAVLAAVVLLQPALRTRLPRPRRLAAILERGQAQLRRYREHPYIIVTWLVLSVTTQLLGSIGVWMSFNAVGEPVPILHIVLVTAMINVAGLLPISISGWGIRESLFLVLLVPYHPPSGGVLAGVLLGRALFVLVSLPGLIPLALEVGPPHLLSVLRQRIPEVKYATDN